VRFWNKCIFLIFLLAIILAQNSCIGIGSCKNTTEKEIISPDGKIKVVIYNRGCGATVGFFTGISIMPSDQNLTDDDKANIVLAENAVRKYWRDDKQNLLKGKMNFDAEWINDNELLIYYTDSKFLTKRESFENVEIKYKTISK
jgi:hypothetical protein